jgi:hypothetical protein
VEARAQARLAALRSELRGYAGFPPGELEELLAASCAPALAQRAAEAAALLSKVRCRAASALQLHSCSQAGWHVVPALPLERRRCTAPAGRGLPAAPGGSLARCNHGPGLAAA